jgi:hypothetical protein
MTTWRNCQSIAKVVHKDGKDKDELFQPMTYEDWCSLQLIVNRRQETAPTHDDDNEEDNNSDQYDPNLE